MLFVQGTSIVEQNAMGTLHFLHRDFPAPPQDTTLSWEQEWERFLAAQRQGVLELAGLYDRASQEVGGETAAIFAIHAMLLEDEDLTQLVYNQIFERHTSAEYAVWKTAWDVASSFRAMDDTYMQARSADILDIAGRVIRVLKGERPELAPEQPAILVADYFLPSEVMCANRNHKLLGVISRKGTPDSHTALLLRAYRIPTIVNVELEPCWEGHVAVLDGRTGQICLDPDRGMEEMDQAQIPAGIM